MLLVSFAHFDDRYNKKKETIYVKLGKWRDLSLYASNDGNKIKLIR